LVEKEDDINRGPDIEGDNEEEEEDEDEDDDAAQTKMKKIHQWQLPANTLTSMDKISDEMKMKADKADKGINRERYIFDDPG
jgi:hypothetical protein